MRCRPTPLKQCCWHFVLCEKMRLWQGEMLNWFTESGYHTRGFEGCVKLCGGACQIRQCQRNSCVTSLRIEASLLVRGYWLRTWLANAMPGWLRACAVQASTFQPFSRNQVELFKNHVISESMQQKIRQTMLIGRWFVVVANIFGLSVADKTIRFYMSSFCTYYITFLSNYEKVHQLLCVVHSFWLFLIFSRTYPLTAPMQCRIKVSGVASPKIWGRPKCLILGEWHYFV